MGTLIAFGKAERAPLPTALISANSAEAMSLADSQIFLEADGGGVGVGGDGPAQSVSLCQSKQCM